MYSAEAGVIFGQTLEFALAFFFGLRGHAGFFHFLAQLFDFRLRVVEFAELFLNGLHLLAQQDTRAGSG